MSPKRRAKEFACKRCRRKLSSQMRLQHHLAAEHAPKTLQDILTVSDIRGSRDVPHSTTKEGAPGA